MGRILAIDYGQKRTGIAVTDELQIIASPLVAIPTSEVIPFLQGYIKKENVVCIVVGEPKQMDNSASESAQIIEPFVKKLRKLFPEINIDRFDERFTSKIASQTILEAGLKKKDRQDKKLVDIISATLILQSYLVYKNN